MKTGILATSFLVAALALPIAAQAATDCGVPQGYGTNNPNTFNRSTCGLGDNGYNVPNAAAAAGGRQRNRQPAPGYREEQSLHSEQRRAASGQQYGRTQQLQLHHPVHLRTTPAADQPLRKPAGYGTNNRFHPEQRRPASGEQHRRHVNDALPSWAAFGSSVRTQAQDAGNADRETLAIRHWPYPENLQLSSTVMPGDRTVPRNPSSAIGAPDAVLERYFFRRILITQSDRLCPSKGFMKTAAAPAARARIWIASPG